MARTVLIDCDPGIDDMVALLTACASPEFDLRGVTTVGGNVGIDLTTRNARSVPALAGRGDVPVAAGATRSLVRVAVRDAETAHGGNGLGGIVLPEPEVAPDPRHAVEFLAATVAAASEPVTLFAVGPLTNVALAARPSWTCAPTAGRPSTSSSTPTPGPSSTPSSTG
jgi:inosine-uridine nucleoside N-ribohydrolase